LVYDQTGTVGGLFANDENFLKISPFGAGVSRIR